MKGMGGTFCLVLILASPTWLQGGRESCVSGSSSRERPGLARRAGGPCTLCTLLPVHIMKRPCSGPCQNPAVQRADDALEFVFMCSVEVCLPLRAPVHFAVAGIAASSPNLTVVVAMAAELTSAPRFLIPAGSRWARCWPGFPCRPCRPPRGGADSACGNPL